MNKTTKSKILSIACALAILNAASAPAFAQLAQGRLPASAGAFGGAVPGAAARPIAIILIAGEVPALGALSAISAAGAPSAPAAAAPAAAQLPAPAALAAEASGPETLADSAPGGAALRAADELAARAAPRAGEAAGSAAAAAALDETFDHVVATDGGDIVFTGRRFPDGEIEMVNRHPEETSGRRATITHDLKTPADLVQTLFMLENLRSYGAAQVRLNLTGWNPSADDGLPRLLRSFSDAVSLRPHAGADAAASFAPWERRSAVSPSRVDEVLYIQDRFAPLAANAAKAGGHPATQIRLRKADTLDGWSAELPGDMSGRHVFLIHSTENEERVAELLLSLIALRRSGAASVTLVNTYEGYARQDQKWKQGQTIAALAMLKVENLLTDRHVGINIHYTDKIENGRFHNEPIESVNGFPALARRMFRSIARRLARPRVPGGKPPSVLEAGQRLSAAFAGRPLVLVAPDDGAFPMVVKTALALSQWIEERWGISLEVRAAYIDKKRIDAHTVEMAGGLLTGPGQPLELLEGFENAFAFVLDDETAQGSTLLSVTYALVRLGLPWRSVYTGVIQGKLNRGLEPFASGLDPDQLASAQLPARIDDKRGRMPPIRFFASQSLPLPAALTGVSLSPTIGELIKEIDGKR